MAIRVEGERDFVSETPAELVTLGIVLPPIGGGRVDVEDSDSGAHIPGVHIEVGVATHGDENQVGLVGDDMDGPAGVDTAAHVLDNGLLIRQGLGGGIVVPGPDVGLGAGVELLAIGAQAETVVEADILVERLAAGDAAVGAKGEDVDALPSAKDEEVSGGVEHEGAGLLEPSRNLGHLPVGVDLVREAVRGDVGAGGGEGDGSHFGGFILGQDC